MSCPFTAHQPSRVRSLVLFNSPANNGHLTISRIFVVDYSENFEAYYFEISDIIRFDVAGHRAFISLG